ncbi:MAG: hypothetical protein QXI09_01865 [Candidatus Aenigmatarchaeota archaeon]
MERVSYLSVIILLLSLVVIREGIKVETSKMFGCYYGKNILIDSNLYSYSFLICDKISHILFSLLSFLSIFSLSFVFKVLEDQRIFYFFFLFSFFFLLFDILTYYDIKTNYITFSLLFLFSIPSIVIK